MQPPLLEVWSEDCIWLVGPPEIALLQKDTSSLGGDMYLDDESRDVKVLPFRFKAEVL